MGWGGGGELIAIISQFGISSFSKLQWFFALEIYAPLNSLYNSRPLGNEAVADGKHK